MLQSPRILSLLTADVMKLNAPEREGNFGDLVILLGVAKSENVF